MATASGESVTMRQAVYNGNEVLHHQEVACPMANQTAAAQFKGSQQSLKLLAGLSIATNTSFLALLHIGVLLLLTFTLPVM